MIVLVAGATGALGTDIVRRLRAPVVGVAVGALIGAGLGSLGHVWQRLHP